MCVYVRMDEEIRVCVEGRGFVGSHGWLGAHPATVLFARKYCDHQTLWHSRLDSDNISQAISLLHLYTDWESHANRRHPLWDISSLVP